MKNVYLTIVNGKYALRGYALFLSIQPYLKNNIFVVYCVDEIAKSILEPFVNCQFRVIEIKSFENRDLLSLKDIRKTNEFCWTCKPFIIENAFSLDKDIDWGVYLDSDMMSFGDPDSGLPECSNTHVVLTPHRPSDRLFAEQMPVTGNFNAGYAAFRNTDHGRKALQWWRQKCTELCPSLPVNGIYADQKYLDELSQIFLGVEVDAHLGLNVAPWNVEGVELAKQGDRVLVNGLPLLIYHMQAFRYYGPHISDHYDGNKKLSRGTRSLIYKPYEVLLRRSLLELSAFNSGYVQEPDAKFLTSDLLIREFKKLVKRISNLTVFGCRF